MSWSTSVSGGKVKAAISGILIYIQFLPSYYDFFVLQSGHPGQLLQPDSARLIVILPALNHCWISELPICLVLQSPCFPAIIISISGQRQLITALNSAVNVCRYHDRIKQSCPTTQSYMIKLSHAQVWSFWSKWTFAAVPAVTLCQRYSRYQHVTSCPQLISGGPASLVSSL